MTRTQRKLVFPFFEDQVRFETQDSLLSCDFNPFQVTDTSISLLSEFEENKDLISYFLRVDGDTYEVFFSEISRMALEVRIQNFAVF